MSGSDRVTVGLDLDGYDVEVEIHPAAIERHLRRLEENEPEMMGRHGPGQFDFSKFAKVKVDPTSEQWDILADLALEARGIKDIATTGSDRDGGGA